jgi:hypothetical protein
MQLSQTALDILEVFRQAHRRPGARIAIAKLEAQIGSDPAVVVAVSELVRAGYLAAPDAGTVELTTTGFDHLQAMG